MGCTVFFYIQSVDNHLQLIPSRMQSSSTAAAAASTSSSSSPRQQQRHASANPNNGMNASGAAANVYSGRTNTETNAFYELEVKDTRLKILRRYTNIGIIGAGAQGLVL